VCTIDLWRRIETITRQLELCEVGRGDVAAVLSGSDSDESIVEIVASALGRLGCITVQLGIGPITDAVAPAAVRAALGQADVVVDVRSGLSARLGQLAPDGRCLILDIADVNGLDHLVSHPGVAQRAGRLSDLLWASNSFRIEGASRAALQIRLEACRVHDEIGVASRPGDVARFPAATVWCAPDPTLVSGTVVAMPGDVVAEAGHILRSPVRLEIDRGHLVEILGESDDADLIRVQLEHHDTDAAYVVARIGIGLALTRAIAAPSPFSPTRITALPAIAGAGNCTVVFGEALTLTLTSASVSVHETPVVIEGRLVGALTPDIYEQAAASR
jgi:2,5-dihydroxypyridine 5,6-dioxygenase